MYLKTLQLQGFKSFAEKTDIDFSKGLTAIVGPNGCGKSNMVDAIRWVLGETSAKALRGGEMSDVIFNGTENRKGYGMAEATLIFSDCEDVLGSNFSEIALSRKIYRDGNSEYSFNKNKCRLKDIQDIFMNTGVATSCYSIMEQGKIDMLLSSKPEERRIVFEEAAGITKFKKERSIALRKLEQTEENLLRVSEVLEEQERTIQSLKRQKQKAEIHQSLNQASKLFYLCYARNKNLELNNSRQEAKKILLNLEKQIEEKRRTLHLQKKECNQNQIILQEIQERIIFLREQKESLKHQISKIEHQISLSKERCLEWKNIISSSRQEIGQSTLNFNEAKPEKKDSLDSQKEEFVLSDQKEKFSNLQKSLEEAASSRANSENSLHSIMEKIQAYQICLRDFEYQFENRKKSLQISEEKSEQIDRFLEEKQGTLKDFVQKEEAINQKISLEEESLKKQLSAIEKKEKDLIFLKQKKGNHLKELNQILEEKSEKEGRRKGIYSLIETRQNQKEKFAQILKNQEGVLSEEAMMQVLDCLEIQTPYLKAIESFLSESLNAILLKNSDYAEKISLFLKERDFGNLSFFVPSSDIPFETPSLDFPEGAECFAKDCILANPEISSLIGNLLSNVVIVSCLEKVFEMHQKDKRFTYVSLQGDIFSSDGIFLPAKRQLLLQSIKEEKILSKSIVLLEKKNIRLRKELEEKEEIFQKTIEEIEEKRKSFYEIQKSFYEARNIQSASIQKKEQLLSEISHLEDEKGNLLNERKKQLSAEEKQKEDFIIAQREGEELEKEKEENSSNLVDLISVENAMKEQLEEVRIRMRLFEDIQNSEAQEILMAKNHRRELEKLISNRRQIIFEKEKETEKLQTENENLEEEKLKLEKTFSEISNDFGKTETLEQEKKKELEKLQRKLEEFQQSFSSYEERTKAEISLEKIRLQEEQIQQEVFERYEIEDINLFQINAKELSFYVREHKNFFLEKKIFEKELKDSNTLPNFQEEDFNELGNSLSEIVSAIRFKLGKLGGVNLDSIEEYEELEKRSSLVRGQCEDLVASKKKLIELIEKLNTESISKFMSTFKETKNNFKEVFQKLFGPTAKASISLIDEENPLESGIDIIVRPPGKKLQTLSLLSGGEKSMSAVALLFAIYKVKPSPFCILDELDAPLDDANIEKFLNVLKTFLNQSQFIIITHNKKTMRAADFIYGVTMREAGISELIGVTFEKEKLRSVR